jgi:MFS family permease
LVLGALSVGLLVPAIWAARQVPAQPSPGHSHEEPLGLVRLAPTVAWYLLYGAGYVSYMTFVVALLHARGVSTFGEAAFFIVLGVSSVITTLAIWGRILSRLHGGHAPALISVVVLVGVLPVLISHSVTAALVSAVVFGAGFMAGPTAATVLARRMLPAHGWTAGIAFLTVAFSVGQGIGPPVAGLLSDSAGGITRGLWLSVVLLAMAAAVALAQREPAHVSAHVASARRPESRPLAGYVPFQRILLAVDGSSRDLAAERLAVVLARTLDVAVDVLHVESEGASTEGPRDAGARSAVDISGAAVGRLVAAGARATGHVIRAPEVDIADAIADTATELGADLVIAAPHHRDRLGRWLEPSITEELTERSTAAVLLVA